MPDEIDIDLEAIEDQADRKARHEWRRAEQEKPYAERFRLSPRIAEGDSWDRTATYGLTPPDWGN